MAETGQAPCAWCCSFTEVPGIGGHIDPCRSAQKRWVDFEPYVVFDLHQIFEATYNFSEDNKLGEGGFGPVYKDQFPEAAGIGVKRLASHSGQGFVEFKIEVHLMAKFQHTNLVTLDVAHGNRRKFGSMNTCQRKAWTSLSLFVNGLS
ncbi:Cysteine-rich receptor-like protein kinase 10 [Zea mays]|uniref:Cysteine-rich receptor-like protein kinase 10 n=1 Tax=Zea mays TaxID=4577 RepID=A0A1D6GWN2_MAIZE|nr:Cysteine-rich receptor-like protein kinase 10 [Zea mays]